MRSEAGLIRRVGETMYEDAWVTPLARALGVSRKSVYVWLDEPPADIAARLLGAVKAERERLRRHARTVDALVEQLEGLQ